MTCAGGEIGAQYEAQQAAMTNWPSWPLVSRNGLPLDSSILSIVNHYGFVTTLVSEEKVLVFNFHNRQMRQVIAQYRPP